MVSNIGVLALTFRNVRPYKQVNHAVMTWDREIATKVDRAESVRLEAAVVIHVR
jgi:hypothetical protein